MFNGIIFNLGEIISIKKYSKSILICVKTKLNLKKSELGSSISCNGVCLTISKVSKRNIFFYVSNETIRRSNFKNLKVGDKVNLEKSLVYGQKISGNFTQGHVDTTAIISDTPLIEIDAFSTKNFFIFLSLSFSFNDQDLSINVILLLGLGIFPFILFDTAEYARSLLKFS